MFSWFIFQVNWFKFFSHSFLGDIQIFKFWIGLPCLLKFDHLLDWKLNFFIGRIAFLSNPINKLLLLNYWFPVFRIPFKLVQFLVGDTWCTTNEDYTWVITVFYINVPQYKNVGISAYKTLDGQITKLWFRMSCDFVVFRLDQMKDNMGSKASLSLKWEKKLLFNCRTICCSFCWNIWWHSSYFSTRNMSRHMEAILMTKIMLRTFTSHLIRFSVLQYTWLDIPSVDYDLWNQ